MKIPESNKEMTRRKILLAFPSNLHTDVEKVLVFLQDKNLEVHSTSEYAVTLNGESLIIPGRVYGDPPPETISQLTEVQQTILNCIYLRHSNGYLRQTRLELLKDNMNPFVIPYTFQLLGEYVSEILVALDGIIDENTIAMYVKFIGDNPQYWQKTQGRVASYWGEYYRGGNKKFSDYIGYKIVKRLSVASQTKTFR